MRPAAAMRLAVLVLFGASAGRAASPDCDAVLAALEAKRAPASLGSIEAIRFAAAPLAGFRSTPRNVTADDVVYLMFEASAGLALEVHVSSADRPDRPLLELKWPEPAMASPPRRSESGARLEQARALAERTLALWTTFVAEPAVSRSELQSLMQSELLSPEERAYGLDPDNLDRLQDLLERLPMLVDELSGLVAEARELSSQPQGRSARDLRQRLERGALADAWRKQAAHVATLRAILTKLRSEPPQDGAQREQLERLTRRLELFELLGRARLVLVAALALGDEAEAAPDAASAVAGAPASCLRLGRFAAGQSIELSVTVRPELGHASVARTAFEVLRPRRFGHRLGFMLSELDDPEYELELRAAGDPAGTALAPAQVTLIERRSGATRIMPVYQLSLFLWPHYPRVAPDPDDPLERLTPWRSLRPYLTLGLGLESPSENYLIGVGVEPVPGVSVAAGAHLAEVERPAAGVEAGVPVALEPGTSVRLEDLVRDELRAGGFVSLSVDPLLLIESLREH